MLVLERPIAFFDIESTGVDTSSDRIIELNITKVFPDRSQESKTILVNPGIPIPKKSSDIHGFTDEVVKDQPLFKRYAKGIHDYIQNCDIGSFNGNSFDRVMLYNEFLRCGIEWDYHKHRFLDAGNIMKRKEERTLTAAYKMYCGKDLEGAHGAEADVKATIEVFFAQLHKYDDLPDNIEQLALYCNYDRPVLDISGKFSFDDDGDIIFNFGQSRGQKVKENVSLLHWMITKNFNPDTLDICHRFLNGDFYKPDEEPKSDLDHTGELPF